MQNRNQKTVSFANSPNLTTTLSKIPNKSKFKTENFYKNESNQGNNDIFDISYYFCENSRKDFRGTQQKSRRYCSFCRRTHDKFSSGEGIERFFRNTTIHKRFNSMSSSNDSDVSSEESFVTRISSESGQMSSSSLNSLSIEGEKMYKLPSLEMAKERVMKRHNVSRESTCGDSSHGDDSSKRRVTINIVLPSIVYESDQFL